MRCKTCNTRRIHKAYISHNSCFPTVAIINYTQSLKMLPHSDHSITLPNIIVGTMSAEHYAAVALCMHCRPIILGDNVIQLSNNHVFLRFIAETVIEMNSLFTKIIKY